MKKSVEKTNKSKRIGQKMKELREKKGFSLQQVSNELKKFNTSVSAATLQRYEIGEISRIPLDRVSALSKIYNTTPEYLMDWEKHDTETKKSERDLMIEKYQLTPEELAEYDRIMKLSIEMNTLMFQSNNIELEVADKEEMDYELSETLKKAFISSLITKRKKEKKE